MIVNPLKVIAGYNGTQIIMKFRQGEEILNL